MSVNIYLPGAYQDDNACVLEIWRDDETEKILHGLKEDARWLQRISDFSRYAPVDVKNAIGSIRLPETCGISVAPVKLSPKELAEETEGMSFDPEKPCILSDEDVNGILHVQDDDLRSSGEHGCTLEISLSGNLWAETPLNDFDEDAGTACAEIDVDDLAELLKPVLEASQNEGGPKP